MTFPSFALHTQPSATLLVKIALRVAALGMILLVLADWASSGIVDIRGAKIISEPFPQAKTITLPYRVNSRETRYFYDFYFTLPADPLRLHRDIRLIPDDCIRMLRIDGYDYPIDANASCDLDWGVELSNPSAVLEGRKFHVLIEDTRSVVYGLRVWRESLLSSSGMWVLTLAGIYLFLISYLRSWPVFLEAHKRLIPFAFFIAVFNPRNATIDSWEWYLRMPAQGVALAALCFALAYLPLTRGTFLYSGQKLSRIVTVSGSHWVLGCALVFLGIAAALSHLLFDGIPHIADSHTQSMQSRIFASGKLYELSHPLRAFFDFQFVINDGKYYSSYFPGHSVLLAIGQIFGAPWLVNPTIGALTVFAVYLLAKELAGKSAGMIASALMLVAPFVLFMSSEFMQHGTVMLFLTLFVYFYIRMLKSDDRDAALLAGLCVGYAFFTRVHAAVPYAAPLALYSLYYFLRSPRRRLTPCLALFMGFFFWVCMLGFYQYATSGDPFISGYQNWSQWNIGWSAIGHAKSFLEPERWLRIFSDYDRALWQYVELQKVLFNWPTTSLLLVFALYLLKAQSPYSFVLLLCLAGQFLGLIFILDRGGTVMEPRFVYESSALIIVLSAVFLKRFPALMRVMGSRLPRQALVGIAAMWVLLNCLLALPNRTIDQYRMYANNFWEGNADYYRMLVENTQKPALIFIKPYEHFRLVYFNQPPRDDADIIFARDRGYENRLLMDYYPKRTYYLADHWELRKVTPRDIEEIENLNKISREKNAKQADTKSQAD